MYVIEKKRGLKSREAKQKKEIEFVIVFVKALSTSFFNLIFLFYLN